MIPESLTLKWVGAMTGALAGLTVLVRLGRLLEALETVQSEVKGLRLEVAQARQDIAELRGRTE